MVVAQRHLGVGAADADDGDTGVAEGVGPGNGHAGAVGPQDHADAGGNQLRGSGDGLIVGALVVHDHQLHVVGLAADVHGGGDIVGVLGAQGLLFARRAVVAGRGLEDTDFHGVAGGAAAAARTAAGAQGQYTHSHYQSNHSSFHFFTSFSCLGRPFLSATLLEKTVE